VEENMPSALLGKKLGMTQVFDESGKVTPVTVIAAGPCVVTQLKTLDRDGYSAVQIGYGEIKEHRLTSPLRGHFIVRGVKPHRTLREIPLDQGEVVAEGAEIKADIFVIGDKVSVTGVSKGKGFAGGVKRYHFRGHKATHGGSTSHRKPASGGATDAARTFKGSRRPGHMGNEQVTQQGLRVVRVDIDKNLLLVRGAIPGANGGLVMIKKFKR
jgi:large subunit ribosomal protein L3